MESSLLIAKEKAAFYKQEQLLKGQGDSAYDREVAKGREALYSALGNVIGPDNLAVLELVKITFEKSDGKVDITPDILVQGGNSNGLTGAAAILSKTILAGAFAPTSQPADSQNVQQGEIKK